MKYLKWYNQLIKKAKTQMLNEEEYVEKHHIIPRHCGGGDNPTNIVKLTYRQHILAHLLLWKTYNRLGDETAYKFMKGIGSHDRKKLIATLGGKVQGKINAENGHLSRIAKLPRKRKMSDMIWITDNNTTKWHPKNESIPNGWRRGRVLKNNKIKSKNNNKGKQ